jgi:hypothetical protein
VIDEGWVTVETAAHAADVDASTLLAWCRDGTIDSFRNRQAPHLRFVRLDDVRQHVYGIRGRPQTSLHTLIACYAGVQPRTSEALISDLQSLIRERELAS